MLAKQVLSQLSQRLSCELITTGSIKYLEHGGSKLGTNSGFLRRQPINQFRHHVIRQMIQKLAYRVDSLLARRASCNDNALAALRD